MELWIVILSFVFAFCMAFAIGGNDVGNSFGTSVGSKALSMTKACIIATICEMAGAVFMGYKVSNTVRKGIFEPEIFQELPMELSLGFFAVIIATALCTLFATMIRQPISGTHSMVGAVIGFVLVLNGYENIKWKMLGTIEKQDEVTRISWIVSPLLSGILSVIVFFLVKKLILSKENFIKRGYNSMPVFVWFTILINLFSIIHDGPSYLGFDILPIWGVLLISAIIGILFALGTYFIYVPFLKNSYSSTCDVERGEKNVKYIARDEVSSEVTSNDHNGSIIAIKEICVSVDEVEKKRIKVEKESGSSSVDVVPPAVTESAISSDSSPNDVDNDEDDHPQIAKIFSVLQILTAIFASFAHGANDVSNAVGPLIAVWSIYQTGNTNQNNEPPFWLMIYGGIGISFGLWILGKKVMHTIGERLTKINPSNGFCIELGAAVTVLFASKFGLPISTTHCKVGSVILVGLANSKGVSWKPVIEIICTWVLTVPISCAVSAAVMVLLKKII
ncbi:sodium-dependent phosphate transporter 1-A [Caerostris extrusa]|uniref:Phosphate transporter n=1 Tax=Caerostris extrusa TaxID=172846 RepID=A0AAV4NM87_CAEEX|nr:sodium-dependent phosphate transporter 1-A [Caerostris extrusa]